MKINSEQKCNRRKHKNRKRSKKRKGNRRRFNKYQKTRTVREPRPVSLVRMNGESYWMNYNNVIQWQRNYLDYINNCHLSPETSFSLNTDSLSTSDSWSQTVDFMASKVVDFTNESNSEYHTSHYEDHDDEGEEEEEEFEVSEEMMDFIEKSMKHREAMRLKKAEAERVSNESKEKDIEEASEKGLGRDDVEECQTPKGKTIDEKRILEMSELYGKSSAMILGMETALQLTFNRNCDVYKPAFWPCLPLKIHFDNK